jgi:AcrR family transcriptional regulator
MPKSRKEETQERIVGAAMHLFAVRGYDATSITQIASRAGVSRAAVFWHFGDKAGLFREAGKRFLVPFREEFDAALRDLAPRKRLFEIFAVYEDFVRGNREQIEAFVRWVIDSPEPARLLRDDLLALHERYRSEIEATLAELLGDAAEARALADGLLSLLDGNLLLAIFDSDPRAGERRSAGLQAIAERLLKEHGDR